MNKQLEVGDVIYYTHVSYQERKIYRTKISRVTAKRAYAPSIYNKNIECAFVREYSETEIKNFGSECECWEIGEEIARKYEAQAVKQIIEKQLLIIKDLIAKKTDLHELETMSNKLVEAIEANNE